MLRAILVSLCLAVPAWAQDKPVVVTVNYPLAYMAERLLGDAGDVVMPIPAGQDPSFWRPGVADITEMQKADAVLLNGAGFATWITKASLSRSKLVDTSRGLEDRFIATETITHSHGGDAEHSHDATANYLWLDFTLAAEQAEGAAKGLTRRLRAVEGIEGNLEALKTDFAALDAAASALAPLAEGRKIIASHPRYQYFARAYGLEISSLDWAAGETPNAAQWAALGALIGDSEDAIFLWEAEPPEAARAQTAELGVADMVFAPLANSPEEGDFLSLMQGNVETLLGLLNAGG